MERKQSASSKWLTLFLVALAGGLVTKLPYLRETYMVPLQNATGSTMTQLGLLMSAYGVVNFICYFPGGILADKFSCKSLIVFSCIGTGLTGLWFWTMPGFVWLVVIHAIFAVTTVFTFWAAMVKAVNRLGDASEQGTLFGLLEGGRGLIGTIVAFGSVAAFDIAADQIGGMKNAILYYSVLNIAVGVLIQFLMINDKPEKKENVKSGNTFNRSDVIEVLKMPRVWLCGALGICNYSALIFHGAMTGYMSVGYGLSDTLVGNLNVVRTYGMMAVGAFLAGFVADRIGSRIRFMKYAFIGMTIFGSVYLLIPTHGAAVPLVVLNFVVFGLSLYSIKALYFSTIDEVLVPKRLAGTASGIISLVTYFPEIFLYTVQGKMIDQYAGTATPLKGYQNCFIAMIVLSALGVVCGFILHKSNQKALAAAKAAEGV